MHGHTNGDVEKGANVYHNSSESGLHHNGVVGNHNSTYTHPQDGGAPLNLRNITPGGHPLDRVSRLESGRTSCLTVS